MILGWAQKKFMDNIFLRMSLPQPRPERGSEISSKTSVYEDRSPGEENTSYNLHDPSCLQCSFPNEIKRREFLHHRVLCPGDVDVDVVAGEPQRLLCSAEEMNHRKLTPPSGEIIMHAQEEPQHVEDREESTDTRSPAFDELMHTLSTAAAEFGHEKSFNSTRTVDDTQEHNIHPQDLEPAVSSFLTVQTANKNNSSSASPDDSNTDSGRSAVEERRLQTATHEQRGNARLHPTLKGNDTLEDFLLPTHTLGMNYLRHPVMRKGRRDGFYQHPHRLALRYQPYRVMRAKRPSRSQHARQHPPCLRFKSQSSGKIKFKQAKWLDMAENMTRLKRDPADQCDLYKDVSGGHANTCWRVCSPGEVKPMLLGQQLARNVTLCPCCFCVRKRSGFPYNENFSYKFCLRRRKCLDRDGGVSCREKRTSIGYNRAYPITQPDINVYPGTERFANPEFLCRPAQGFAEVLTNFAMPNARHEISCASDSVEETVSQHKSSIPPRSGDFEMSNRHVPTNPLYMLQALRDGNSAPITNIKAARDLLSESLFKDSNENNQTFKFSSPDVVLSKSKQEVIKSLYPSVLAEDETVRPPSRALCSSNRSPQRSAAHEALVHSSSQTDLSNLQNITCSENVTCRDSLANRFYQEQKKCPDNSKRSIYNPHWVIQTEDGLDRNAQKSRCKFLDDGQIAIKRFAETSIKPSTLNQRNDPHPRGNPRAHCSQYRTQINKDVTSNNNNNDLSWPVNNNSCNPPRAHSQGAPALGGRVIRVEGDGRCLFRSLVTAEYPPLQVSWRDEFGRPVNRELAEFETSRADDLRGRVVSIMADNMHFYSQLERGIINADQPQPSSYQRFMDRLRAMSNPTTMPGDLELNAVAMVMERQIYVLNTDLAIITSYGHDRFPQSVPLAVRYTRLVADVGHYDAVILFDDVSSGPNDQSNGSGSGSHMQERSSSVDGPVQQDPSRHSALCGHFQRLNTKGDGESCDTPCTDAGTCPPKGRGGSGGGGDAKLNAKKEFFYLRDTDKILHSEGLQPVPAITTKGVAPEPATQQNTAEATTSTARAEVYWPPGVAAKRVSRRRKRRTFLDKHTQTEDGGYRWVCCQKDRASKLKKRSLCQNQCGVCKATRATNGRKRRSGLAVIRVAQKVRRDTYRLRDDGDGKTVDRYQNINWNSRAARNLKLCRARMGKTDVLQPESLDLVKPGVFLAPKVKGNQRSTLLMSSRNNCCNNTDVRSYGRVRRLQTELMISTSRHLRSKLLPCHRRGLPVIFPTKAKVATRKRKPNTYIRVCSPDTQPLLGQPGARNSGPPGLCGNARRGQSMPGRNRNRKKRAPTLSPGSPRSPLFLPMRPRLPDAFEPAPCRCVLCNSKVELSARGSVKCYLCGRVAHRACVIRDTPGWGQGGGDQNYFLCSVCVTL